MIRVFIVDDHELVRRGVVDVIDRAPDMHVVGEAGTARQALARAEAADPHVAVLDVRLPDGNGIDVCRQLRSIRPTIACLILTAYDDDAAVDAAVLAGASGYVLKNIGGTKLLESIRDAASGHTFRHTRSAQFAASRLAADSDDPRLGSLGLRERQVLGHIAEGLTNRQIADALGLAEKTVKNYVSSLLTKLGLDTRTQAAIFRLEHPDK
ncbi:response regulator transcription factor [Microbacterium oleivorans]|uniref:response regulator transcription factor n=1 Tax=Microbacterium oleivorans TaxID=273677 RepID=UPI0010A3F66A|nr:response regulator transcription factor [Microbacterium oleivorans]THE07510.1 response regulator transcription factor [Microbacterium oleivorans]